MTDTLRKVIIGILIVGATLLVSKLIMGTKEEIAPNEMQETIPLVQVKQVQLGDHITKVEVYGYLNALNEIELYPEVAGKLLNDNFRKGVVFQKGELIAQFDNKEFLNTLKSGRSQFYSLLTNVIADLEFDFTEEAKVWKSYLDQIDFEKTLKPLPVVESKKLKTFLAAKGVFNSFYQLNAQEERLSKYQIIAPFNGILKETFVKPGTVVRNGQKLGVLVSSNDYEVEVPIQLNEVAYVQVGDEVEFRSEDLSGSWKGKVSRINKTLKKESQNVSLFISIQSNKLFNGMYLTGEVSSKTVENTYVLSRSLLNNGEVYTVLDGKLKSKKVTVISVEKDEVIVTGLSEGETVLSKPFNNAMDGMKVRFE